MQDHNFCIPHLEWEAIAFPLKVTNLSFEGTDIQCLSSSYINIWRDDSYALKGQLSGISTDFKFFENDRFVGKGNIVKGQSIKGMLSDGSQVVLTDCMLTGLRTTSWEYSNEGQYFHSELHFDDIQLYYPHETPELQKQTFLYWYFCDGADIHMDRSTYRNVNHPLKKIRHAFENEIREELEINGSSRSRDHIILDSKELRCIIAQVPEDFPGPDKSGICIEYETTDKIGIDKEILKNLEYLIGFLLGSPLFGLGYSVISDGKVITAYLESPKYIPIKPMPPIQFNRQYNWGNFSFMINKMWPLYYDRQSTLKLDHAISRYWIARDLPLGTNLPVISSAMELLAENYLKWRGENKLEYLSQSDYMEILDRTVTDLKEKLLLINNGDAIWNKIIGAYRKGPNEKMNHFFQLLGLKTGKAEKEAIKLRNKMAHGYRDYTDISAAHDDLILTRTYQILFNRVLLKLLAYEDYYIDYSMKGKPSKPIDVAIG